jgi:large subunit ribosomal protein L13|tara:strand:+ start:2039 stop:2518 length:480 start_codon:yes stop_codon:yes gene_type:complete
MSINPAFMTKFIKKSETDNKWYEIDATNAIVGRIASVISIILRGKNKTTYTPHMDNGDFVVVKNIEHVKFTGNKFQNKKYYRHTGYPGGIKETTPEKLYSKKPEKSLKLAVKRMLPGGPLAKKQLSKLKIYKGSSHPHEAQNPIAIDLSKLNIKNLIRK